MQPVIDPVVVRAFHALLGQWMVWIAVQVLLTVLFYVDVVSTPETIFGWGILHRGSLGKGGWRMPWYGIQSWGWGPMMGVRGFMGIGLVLFLVLLVLAVVWMVKALTRSLRGYAGYAPSGEDSGLRILRERYARGEIDHEEYERVRNHLRD